LHLLEGLEDEIALAEVEDKGLDHLEHADGGEFQIIYAMKGGRTEKVRGNWGRETFEGGVGRFTAGS